MFCEGKHDVVSISLRADLVRESAQKCDLMWSKNTIQFRLKLSRAGHPGSHGNCSESWVASQFRQRSMNVVKWSVSPFWLSSLHYLSVLNCRPGNCKFIIFRIVFRNSTTRFWTPGKLWRCSGAYSGAHHRLHPSNPPRRPSSAGTQDPSYSQKRCTFEKAQSLKTSKNHPNREKSKGGSTLNLSISHFQNN